MTFSFLSKHRVIFATLLTVLISPATALAIPMTSPNVPLNVSVLFKEKVGFRPDCPSQFGGTANGIGAGTHLGVFSFMATDCITPIDFYFSFEGDFLLTAINGDELSGIYGGLFIPVNGGPVHRLEDATMEITGGTGRFAQATGGGTLTGGEHLNTGIGVFQVDGTISNIGRGRSRMGPIRLQAMASGGPTVPNDFVAMFRDFATVESLGNAGRQPAALIASSGLLAVPEPGLLVLLATGLAALRFAQHREKC